MAVPDLYAVLGVSRYATTAEIIESYRSRLAEHPDRLQSKLSPAEYERAVAAWQPLSEAYSTLRDPEKRAAYNQRVADEHAEAANMRAARHRPATSPRIRGDDEHADLNVPFMTALKGGQVDFRTFTIRIRPGATEGSTLRLPGKGGRGWPVGDLHLTLRISDHPFLRRDPDGVTVLMDLPVTWHEAYRRGGGPLEVPTPWGAFLWRYASGEITDGQEVVFEGFGVRESPTDRQHHLKATVRLIAPPSDDLALQQVLQRLQETWTVRAALAASVGGTTK